MNAYQAMVRPVPRPGAARRLICLGFCGGGAAPYKPWASRISGAELVVVCYPGREGRFVEPFATAWDELATDATSSVLLGADRPYTLFGHSMGGWMAFDVVTRIARQGGRLPDALVVSSCNSPDRGVTERDRVPRQDETDEALLDWMRTGGLLPDHIVGDPDFQEMAIELLRADLRVRDDFAAPPGGGTRVPVQVLHGADDGSIEEEVAAQWRRVARGAFRCDELPGGHFYTPDVWADLPAHFASPSMTVAGGSRALDG